MKYSYSSLLLFLTLFCVTPASAETFTPVEDDLSMIFINSITGDIRNATTPETVFGAMFLVFNNLVINIGLLFIVYSVFMGTISVANSGEFLDKEGGLIKVTKIGRAHV